MNTINLRYKIRHILPFRITIDASKQWYFVGYIESQITGDCKTCIITFIGNIYGYIFNYFHLDTMDYIY